MPAQLSLETEKQQNQKLEKVNRIQRQPNQIKRRFILKIQYSIANIQKILMENELDAIQRSFKEIRELEEKRMESEL